MSSSSSEADAISYGIPIVLQMHKTACEPESAKESVPFHNSSTLRGSKLFYCQQQNDQFNEQATSQLLKPAINSPSKPSVNGSSHSLVGFHDEYQHYLIFTPRFHPCLSQNLSLDVYHTLEQRLAEMQE